MMRIITGAARGVRLYTLEGEATRPTSERAKEAIFSMIQFELSGRVVLDLFAGSGQLGLEALSRGAAHAYLCDASPGAVDIIKKNAEKTRLGSSCTVIRADYAEALRRFSGGAAFDIVFLDPPYHTGLIAKSLMLLSEYKLLLPSSLIVCESGDADIFGGLPACDKYEVIKSAKYGVAYVTLLKPAKT